VDIAGSSTKHEDRLVEPDQLQAAWALRRQLHTVAEEGGAPAALEALASRLTSSKTNKALLADVQK
jgi:transcription termination factor Rho